MNIYQLIKIGEHHVNYCEDYVLIVEIGGNLQLAAVMDGCSMGEESYFAATLVGKILRKAAKEIAYQAFFEKQTLTPKIVLKQLLKQLFQELKHLKNRLHLETEELLTTIVLLVIDKKSCRGEVLVIGDGIVSFNGELFEFEQNNKPDYLGYHLTEDFEIWFAKQEQKLSFNDIEDISISTDGIFTFRQFDNKIYEPLPVDLTNFLLNDKREISNPNMLSKKLSIIENKWGLRSTDDLGIIRLIK